MDQTVNAYQSLAERLMSALRQDEFVLFGQAIVPLAPAAQQPFREILIRFQEEENKLLPPGSFFSILEDGGLMPYLDRWVVNRVVRWLRTSLALKPEAPLPHASINLSPDTLTDAKFAEYACKHLLGAALPEGCVSFEISCDSALGQTEGLLRLAERLRPESCRFVLARYDGSETARELRQRLAPEFVKLSPGLVRLLVQGEAAMERIGTINRECHAAGARTIAEHVEDERTLQQLRQLGIDFAQGFGIAAPQPLGDPGGNLER